VTPHLIGARIKALREERKLSQDDVARLFGFKDRQTVSAIETGERRVSAEELVLAVEKLGASLDYFTDPFLLVGEGRFSWRQTDVGPQRLSAYERNAGRWIAAFRTIAPQVGRPLPLLRQALGLTRQSSYEDAAAGGRRLLDGVAALFGSRSAELSSLLWADALPFLRRQSVEEVELARSLQPFPAIDGHDFAIDVAGLVGEQKAREVGELAVSPGTAERIAGLEFARKLRSGNEPFPRTRSRERARGDGVQADAASTPLDGERACHRENVGFRHG
jgi:DNA-binding XRE family transcriptional regulator